MSLESSIGKIHKASQTNTCIAKLDKSTIGLAGGNRYTEPQRLELHRRSLGFDGPGTFASGFNTRKKKKKKILPVCRIPEGSVEVKPVAVEANRYLYIVKLEHV